MSNRKSNKKSKKTDSKNQNNINAFRIEQLEPRQTFPEFYTNIFQIPRQTFILEDGKFRAVRIGGKTMTAANDGKGGGGAGKSTAASRRSSGEGVPGPRYNPCVPGVLRERGRCRGLPQRRAAARGRRER